MGVVLVVEDQSAVRYALRVLLTSHGFSVTEAASPAEAERALVRGDVDLVVQDMNFTHGATSGDEGVALFRRLRAAEPDLPVILVTAWASLESAVQLTKEGAADYLAKPWNDERLVTTVRAHLGVRGDRESAAVHSAAAACGIVYRSPAMHRLVSLAMQVARESVPVLILGPNGSGKDLLAELVQRYSRRSSGPFVKVNAGALPDNLLEAELFGAEAGAFTGATKARTGRFEDAHGGTLFLDEIGNLSLQGQMRLLRVLQSGEFERLGSTRTRTIDVRLLSATNLNVYSAVQAGSFREDLLYRINVIELRVPPLVERPDDIVPIARALLAALARERGAPPQALTPQAERALERHHWPGNVRELRNCIQRALVFASGARAITAEQLALPAPPSVGAVSSPARAATPRLGTSNADPGRAEIETSLVRHGGRVRLVAAELGLSRQALYRRLEKLGVDVNGYRHAPEDDE